VRTASSSVELASLAKMVTATGWRMSRPGSPAPGRSGVSAFRRESGRQHRCQPIEAPAHDEPGPQLRPLKDCKAAAYRSACDIQAPRLHCEREFQAFSEGRKACGFVQPDALRDIRIEAKANERTDADCVLGPTCA
jgi:hypothetical protein